MMRSVKELFDYQILSQDERFGNVHDMWCDDQSWIVRYLEIDTGNWLPGRKVLVPPSALGQPQWSERVFPVSMTRQQIEQSPSIARDEPINRDRETELFSYYGWQPYWAGGILADFGGRASMATALSGGAFNPMPSPDDAADPDKLRGADVPRPSEIDPRTKIPGKNDPHLRSAKAILGDHIKAADGEIGHVDDLIVDDQAWAIRYAVVSTRNWLPGRKVLLAVSWIDHVGLDSRRVVVDLPRQKIERSPEYDPRSPINRQWEEVFFDYYGRPRYWL